MGTCFCILMIWNLVSWISGTDTEPTVFAFSILMSFALALPRVARQVTEQRQLDRMNYDELMQFIALTQKNEWKCVSDDGMEEFLYLRDPSLRIKHFSGEEGTQNDDFKEPWANKFPDPRAYGLYFDLYHNGERLKRIILVAVDGCRAYLPCPRPGTITVSNLCAKIASLVNHNTQLYDNYFQRAGLQHEDAKTSSE